MTDGSLGICGAEDVAASYDVSPAFQIPTGRIGTGYAALAAVLTRALGSGARHVAVDGFQGVLWQDLRRGLSSALGQVGAQLSWVDTTRYLRSTDELEQLIAPNLGGDDPLFGRICDADLEAFLDMAALRAAVAAMDGGPVLVYGPGASLVEGWDLLMYVDVPKDEIQRRMRAGAVCNLGAPGPTAFGQMYKRAYFVDWPVLNRHKARLLPRLDWFVDAGRLDGPTVISGDHLRAALQEMAHGPFRPRPWFLPGPWGGQWMREHFPGLRDDVPNYAWSYELIAPENGLVLQSGEHRLEFSFDLLMYQQHREVLGRAAERFGHSFPIRFDYLDTMGGGNLSIQVHPRPDYILEQFGEPYTQDESYYIVTCKPGARVYLGLRDGASPEEFRQAVERSQREQVPIDVDRFVHSVESHPHDLFLIPHGTIHGSGAGNLVLEISATPYIYTFKIYDWVRRDLEGNLRPLNIERAWDNLYFDRREGYVHEYLCPRPAVLRSATAGRELLLGTHEQLFYEVRRYELWGELWASTDDRCHVLNVVGGPGVRVRTPNGREAVFHFGETFVVPAAAGEYSIAPLDARPCMVVFAFVK